MTDKTNRDFRMDRRGALKALGAVGFTAVGASLPVGEAKGSGVVNPCDTADPQCGGGGSGGRTLERHNASDSHRNGTTVEHGACLYQNDMYSFEGDSWWTYSLQYSSSGSGYVNDPDNEQEVIGGSYVSISVDNVIGSQAEENEQFIGGWESYEEEDRGGMSRDVAEAAIAASILALPISWKVSAGYIAGQLAYAYLDNAFTGSRRLNRRWLWSPTGTPRKPKVNPWTRARYDILPGETAEFDVQGETIGSTSLGAALLALSRFEAEVTAPSHLPNELGGLSENELTANDIQVVSGTDVRANPTKYGISPERAYNLDDDESVYFAKPRSKARSYEPELSESQLADEY